MFCRRTIMCVQFRALRSSRIENLIPKNVSYLSPVRLRNHSVILPNGFGEKHARF
jgi:hypothetical protein